MARPKTTEPVLSRIPINLKNELQEIATNEKKSLSKLGRELLNLALQEKKNKEAVATQWRSRRAIREQAKEHKGWCENDYCPSQSWNTGKMVPLSIDRDGTTYRCKSCHSIVTAMAE